MAKQEWKVGDWAVFDTDIVQIMRTEDYFEVSTGTIRTSGGLEDRLRPLTLRNKRTAEWFAWHYGELRKISGERGFNYPDINRHFCGLALQAMDGDEKDTTPYDQASEFVRQARDYKPVIQGVSLFRNAA